MLLKPLLSCFLLGVKLPLVYTTRQQLRFLLNVQKLFIRSSHGVSLCSYSLELF